MWSRLMSQHDDAPTGWADRSPPRSAKRQIFRRPAIAADPVTKPTAPPDDKKSSGGFLLGWLTENQKGRSRRPALF